MTHVPDIQIANTRGLAPPSNLAYSGAPATLGSLITVTPPPQAGMRTSGQRQRALGLIPAAAGSLHPMIMRERVKGNYTSADASTTKHELRKARAQATAMESAVAAAIARDPSHAGEEARKALLTARDANDLVAMLVRRLAEIEATLAKRPIRVTLAMVREPAEVAAEIATHETVYVCLHDGCRGRKWDDEVAMRTDHPSAREMEQRQATHVFALLCDAPLDPLDPDGDRVGYVAALGKDGTTIARVIAKAEEAPSASAEEVRELRGQLAALKEVLADMAKGGKK